MTDIDATKLKDPVEPGGSLAQRVYLSLREAILALDFPPGSVVRKGPICEVLGVSRSPVSEAINRLSAEGLVTVVPQSATRVAYFSIPEIRDGMFLREALELAAVAKVARERTEDQLVRLTRSLRLQGLLVEDRDYAGLYHADEEFHELLMMFTGSKRLLAVTQMASQQVNRARRLLLPTPGRAVDTVEEHRAVVEAIRSKDPETARKAMQLHLNQLIARVESLSRAHPEWFRH